MVDETNPIYDALWRFGSALTYACAAGTISCVVFFGATLVLRGNLSPEDDQLGYVLAVFVVVLVPFAVGSAAYFLDAASRLSRAMTAILLPFVVLAYAVAFFFSAPLPVFWPWTVEGM